MEGELKKKFNIIAIEVDGVRFDRVKLFPNFKKLSSKGTLFSNMVAYAPYTIASLHSIFTGTYGSKNGADNYYGSLSYKRGKFKTITEYLKENGFFTLGDLSEDIVAPNDGFDKLIIQKDSYDHIREHKKMLNEAKHVNQERKNFFLFLHYTSVHHSLMKKVIKHTDFDKEYFKNKKENLEEYDSYIKEMDDYLGRLFEEIKKLGLLNNSIIVIFTDHGASTGDKIGEKMYGSFLYDYTIKTFSIFLTPNNQIKEISSQTRTIDLMPTILDLLDIPQDEKYKKIMGKSLIPLIEDKENEDRIAFCETGGLKGPWPSPKKPNVKAVRYKNWKLIHNETPDSWELYNLSDDSNEQINLYGKSLTIEKELKEELNKIDKENKKTDFGIHMI